MYRAPARRAVVDLDAVVISILLLWPLEYPAGTPRGMTMCTKGMTPGDSRGRFGDLTIAAGVARALLELAVAEGAGREALLRRAGIDAADLRDQDGRVALERYVVLMHAAEELCGDPALGLHFGETVDLSEMSITGMLDHGVETMEDAFAMINHYGNLVVETGAPGPRLAVERRGQEVWIVDTRPDPNAFPELTESTFARIVCGARRFLGEEGLLKAVHVTHRAPDYRDEYERVFRVPVVFASDRNALVYDAAWWEQRITAGPPYVSGILAAHADRLLEDLEMSRSVRGRVERLLRTRLASGDTGMADVAAELGLSRQTLLRRLKAEGVTYARLLDDLRREVAMECLGHGRLSVRQTASRVGFSDPAPFSRAFKRWTGLSPRAFLARRKEE
jgi:AraC-like DNA-binding protein